MKKTLLSVLRLGMFVAVLALLPFISKGPEAQLAQQCVTFNTENDPCPSCCSMPATQLDNDIVAEDSGTGIQSIQNTNYSCGSTPATCNGTACSGTYRQAVSDSGCCIADGSPSASNEPCCPGLIARSDGTCGFCSDTGEACGSSSDCCTSGYTCTNGACAAPIRCFNNPSCSGGTPIILDTGGHGFHLTSAMGGVLFDLTGTGSPVQLGWTVSGADNAFLALPAADGLVHSGKQLFGNFTPQPPSPDPNGFLALAVYDLPSNGGNGDGIIDSRDAIYPYLRLWVDANHDGISQPGELHTLPSLGVNSISLAYKLDRRTDQYGNEFRYRAEVNPGDPTNAGRMAYDVFFVTLNSSGTP